MKAANEGAATIVHHRSRAGRPHGQPPRCPSSKEEDGRQRNLAEDGITWRQRSMAGIVGKTTERIAVARALQGRNTASPATPEG